MRILLPLMTFDLTGFPSKNGGCNLKQIYFIYNSRSGRATIHTQIPMILDRFTAAGYQVTAHPTQSRGDATICAKRACDAGCYDILVCSGGDGTLNEVIQGCMTSQTPCDIGYIPTGSTNDFARGLGIPKEPEEAVDCILQGEPMLCDVGKFNEKYFTYIAAFGAFTEISYQTSQQYKNVLGHVAYILNAISKLSKIRSCRMRIEHDNGVIEDEFLYGMVTNSRSVAKLLSLSDVRWDDGLFEVTLIRKPANLIELHKMITAFSKIQIGFEKRYIHYFRSSGLKVINLDETPVSWTIDGEYGGTVSENKIINLQKAITFRVDPVRRKRAEENVDSAIAVVMPPPEELREVQSKESFSAQDTEK